MAMHEKVSDRVKIRYMSEKSDDWHLRMGNLAPEERLPGSKYAHSL